MSWRRPLAPALLGIAAVALPGCGGDDEARTVTLPAAKRYSGVQRSRDHGKPQDYASVKRVVDRYGERLWDRWDGVTGFGVGSRLNRPAPKAAHVYLIVVTLESGKDLPEHPQSLKGVSIKFVVSGVIKAQ